MSWQDLEVDGYTGVELWSFVTDSAERVKSIRELVSFIVAPQRFVDHPPRRNLDIWDRLCSSRRCVALGGVDAHQIGIRIANRVPLRLMSYKRSFHHLHTHVLTEGPLGGDVDRARELVYSALRKGHAYIALDSVAPARGFRFTAEGDGALVMGDEAPFAGPRLLRAAFPRAARVRLLRDGEEIAQLESATVLEHRAERPGVYRVEAYLHAHGRERTWILSNPIYLR
jgi:hypothetical protein